MYCFPLKEYECIHMKDSANLDYNGHTLCGALYLTDERLVFVGYLLGVTTKNMIEIPIASVKEILSEKTFFIFPNILRITTVSGDNMKFVINHRDEWMKKIQHIIVKSC